MALDRHDMPGEVPGELREEDRFLGHEVEPERSHFGAFLMGGGVVTAGLLAFLYYDTGNLEMHSNRDLLTTGSIARMEAPPVPAGLPIRVAPPAASQPAP